VKEWDLKDSHASVTFICLEDVLDFRILGFNRVDVVTSVVWKLFKPLSFRKLP
jgi:hypothetical protein